MTSLALLAFGLPGYTEWLVLLGLGVMLFGRRLPEVGRAIGKTVIEFRRGLQNFKDEIDSDGDLRSAKDSVRDIQRTLQAPAEIASPKRMFERLTDESTASPAPDRHAAPTDSAPASTVDRSPTPNGDGAAGRSDPTS